MKKERQGFEQRVKTSYVIYKPEHVAFVKALKEQHLLWDDIAEQFNEEFPDIPTRIGENMRGLYKKYKNMPIEAENSQLDAIKNSFATKKINGKLNRDNTLLLDSILTQEQFLEAINTTVKGINKIKIKPFKQEAKKEASEMVKAVLLSDLHFGKLVKSNIQVGNRIKETVIFDYAIARERIQKVAKALLLDIEQDKKNFKISKVILALMGDIIESSTMHGMESLIGCEFGNSEQIQSAIECLFIDLIVPVAQTGIKIDVPCVAGNHDRFSPEKTFNMPGKNNLTWIIYNTLKMLCKQSGLNNVNFIIAVDAFLIYDIFPDYSVNIEHGDLIKAHTKVGLIQQLVRRQNQVKKHLNAIWVGHTHDETVFGRGTAVVNGSLPGQDDYAKGLGYDSVPTQVLLSYVNSKTRKDKFYKHFSIDLT